MGVPERDANLNQLPGCLTALRNLQSQGDISCTPVGRIEWIVPTSVSNGSTNHSTRIITLRLSIGIQVQVCLEHPEEQLAYMEA